MLQIVATAGGVFPPRVPALSTAAVSIWPVDHGHRPAWADVIAEGEQPRPHSRRMRAAAAPHGRLGVVAVAGHRTVLVLSASARSSATTESEGAQGVEDGAALCFRFDNQDTQTDSAQKVPKHDAMQSYTQT